MTIYISGPISNDPNYITHFKKAAGAIARHGHKPINPGNLASYAPGQDWGFYMMMAYSVLPYADAVYLLKGYERSHGALQELKWAIEHNLPIYREDVDELPVQ